MIYKGIIVSLLLILALHVKTRGQAARTAFSSFGLGLRTGPALAANRAMGGVGIGMPNRLHLNTLNPALLVFNQLTMIEAGFVSEQRTLKNNVASEQSNGINVNYFAWAFPIKPGKWTTGIGVSPYTYMNYKTYYTTPLEGSDDNVQGVNDSGSGGVNELYWSNGVSLHKNISVGLKTSYFFGAISNRTKLSLPNSNQPIKYTADILDRQAFSGIGGSVGVSYHLDSLLRKKNYLFDLGLVYSTGAYLQTNLYSRIEQRDFININDSTVLTNKYGGTTIYPQSIGIGMAFGNRKAWLAGMDFSYTLSSQISDIEGNSKGAQDSWKVALGSQFTPGNSLDENYFKRITYRVGFNFKRTPYKLAGNTIDDWGVSIGVSLPIQRVSSITLAAIWGEQGNLTLNGVSETYFQLYCGITFNDRWFIKRKFD